VHANTSSNSSFPISQHVLWRYEKKRALKYTHFTLSSLFSYHKQVTGFVFRS